MTTTTVAGDSTPGGPDPLTALRQVSRERVALDEREYLYVMQARVAGVSWEGIAAALGVSKQAVHKRFRGRTAGDGARFAKG